MRPLNVGSQLACGLRRVDVRSVTAAVLKCCPLVERFRWLAAALHKNCRVGFAHHHNQWLGGQSPPSI